MKKIRLLMIFLILSISIISGCSSDRADFRDSSFGRGANMTEEQRQKMMEERQQKIVEACQEKNEEDSCILESPRGGIEGFCKMMDGNLVCTMDRPEGSMRQSIE